MNRLASQLDIQPGEGRPVSLLLLHYFFMGAAFNFTQAGAFPLFLGEFGAQALPRIYITSAVVVGLVAFVFLRLGQRLPFATLLLLNISFLVICIVVFRFGLALTGATWVVFALPILFELQVSLGNLAFWSLAGRVFTVRQGKRLFGLVGGGQWWAIVITGFMIPPLVAWVGTANLLILAAIAMAGALISLFYITREFGDQLSAVAPGKTIEDEVSVRGVLKSRYVIFILALIILWWIGFYFVDNIFYERSSARFPNAEELASFLGLFLAVLGIFTLLSNTFLTGRVIGRHGLRVGVLVLPIALLAGAAAMSLIGTIGGTVMLLFWLAVLTKLFDMSLGFSIDRAALTILYQPLPPDQRRQVQTLAEGIFQQLGKGLGGVALLVLTTVFAFGVVQLSYVLFIIVLIWVVVGVTLGREYPVMLRKALTRRRLGRDDLIVVDESSFAVLHDGLRSPHPGVVIYSLNMLEAAGDETLATYLPTLLDHPAPEVRCDALERIERLGLTSALPAVGQRVKREPSPAVRGTTLRVLAALGEAEVFEEVSVYLEDPDPQVRRGAVVGLLRSGGIEAVLAGGQKLLQMGDSPEPDERALAAQILGEVGVGRFYQPLVPLLRDGDPWVRRTAMLAAGEVKNPKLWPLVVDGLGSSRVRGAAVTALVEGGQSALPELKAAFTRQGQDREVLVRAATVCGRIGGDDVISFLKDKVDFPDAEVRTHILAALSRCGYQAGNEERVIVHRQIEAEFAQSAWILAALEDIAVGGEAVSLLKEALTARLDHGRERIFLLLSFIYDTQALLQARDTLSRGHASAEKKAYALEVIDVLISQNLKPILLPLIQGPDLKQQAQALSRAFPQPKLGRDERLAEIITAPDEEFDPWTKACALYAVRRLSVTHLSEAVTSALSVPAPLVRETGVWTLADLDITALDSYLSQLRHDPSPQVARALRHLERTRNGDQSMLSTIEKVIILKRASIFAETPDEILAEVALLLEEVELKSGETVFEKGDLGDCMYIIVDGEVRVHDGERTLNHLSEGDVFGEMAVLDPEPRVASVTAIKYTRLFRLDQEPFYELMDDRIEVARGIIQVLTGHLRARVQDVADLHAQVRELAG